MKKPSPNPVLPPPDAGTFAEPDLVARLIRQHGEPWELSDRNEIFGLYPDWWAGLFVAENHIVYDADEGEFFDYDADVTRIYEATLPEKLAVRFRARMLQAAKVSGLVEIRRRRKRAFVAEVMEIVRGLAAQTAPFHHKLPMLPVKNGILELTPKGVVLREFSPDLRFRHKAPADWNPQARCPRFLAEFLEPMLEDPEDRDLLQRQLGLMMFRQNPAQRMVILEGDSAAGKTSLANLIVALIGEDTVCQLRSEHLEKQFELDAFRGRSLLLGNDVGAGFLNSPGAQTLKGLVSKDLYHPEAKNRRNRRSLRGPFSVLIGTNCRLKPRGQGDADAWRRRLVVYPCRTPEGRRRIVNFEDVLLKAEGPGIIAWLVAGAEKGMTEINERADLILSDAQQARIDQLILRADAVTTFIERFIIRDVEGDVSTREAHEVFVKFCLSEGLEPKPQKTLTPLLERALLIKFGRPIAHDLERDGTADRGWNGLRLLPSDWCETG